MNISFRQLLSIQGVLVAAVMPLQSGCGERQSNAQESRITWDSPKMLEIKREWDSLWDTCTQTPEKISSAKGDEYRVLVRMQGDLLRKRLSDNDVHHLAASCGTLPTHWRDWSK